MIKLKYQEQLNKIYITLNQRNFSNHASKVIDRILRMPHPQKENNMVKFILRTKESLLFCENN